MATSTATEAAKTTTTRKKAPARRAETATAKRTPRAAKSAKASAREVVIRMYNVGFGDAFLVTIPSGKQEYRMLFDCGSVEASPAGARISDVAKQMIDDCTDPDGVARIDVLVATHRHKDHVSGFAVPAWDSVEVKEVWMPWTEHPTDAEARRIRELQGKLSMNLLASLAAAPTANSPAGQSARELVAAIADNANPLSNAVAMKRLHSGFSGSAQRRFLPTKGSDSRLILTDALPGIKVHVLGPSRDPEVIRDMDPPKGESYLRLRNAMPGSNTTGSPPFAAEFVLAESAGAWVLTAEDRTAIASSGELSELAVAVSLDKAVNGTSLMLVLEVAGTLLLFPGDAQWGTWKSALADEEWTDLLQRVAFYKIGHHGSHNATPQTFVRDYLPLGCCTMASTLTRKIWPDIPRVPLFTALLNREATIARTDQPSKIGNAYELVDGVIVARVAI